MSSLDPLQQHYTIRLALTREFLKWTHTHRLLDGEGEVQDQLWARKPVTQEFLFGGKYGIQFKTIEQVASFNTAIDAMLVKNKVDSKHKHSLLYLIMFLNQDYEQQSIENNRNNHLHDYSRFILDLIANSLSHFDAMGKNASYQKVYDGETQEFFFAKKELLQSMPIEELVVHIPDEDHKDDIVKYLRVSIYDDELYVPDDLIINIGSRRTLKNLLGETIPYVKLPNNIRYETFNFMLERMLQEHKKFNTEFYHDIVKDNMLSDFKSVYLKYKRHKISNTKSLAIVGTLITDYLFKHKLYTSKRSVAVFLFEYFALFKAIELKKQVMFPENYEELIPFYIRNKVTRETIRNMMKDVGEI